MLLKIQKTQGKLNKGVKIKKFPAVRMTTLCYSKSNKVDWRSANISHAIITKWTNLLLKNLGKSSQNNFFSRVINFEKRQIAQKGRKRHKKSADQMPTWGS